MSTAEALYELRRQGVTGSVYYAVVELVKADREYDEAHKAYAASIIPSVCRAQSARITAAEKRRAIALARFEDVS